MIFRHMAADENIARAEIAVNVLRPLPLILEITGRRPNVKVDRPSRLISRRALTVLMIVRRSASK
jgi:hypothetical protein